MNPFNDFANIEELFRSLSYKDIVRLCQTNRRFREICNSPRGKQLVDEALISALKRYDLIYLFDKLLDKARLGRNRVILFQLRDEYFEMKNDAIVDILIKNNYSKEFYDRALRYIMGNLRGRYNGNRIETRYTPEINDFITEIYQIGPELTPILLVIKLYDRKNYTTTDFTKLNEIFLKRHPESLSYFRNILMR